MDNIQKQLIAKLGEGFANIFPLQYVSNILDKATGETLTILLSRYNHIFIPFTGEKDITRAAVPSIMRRKGLYITYITPDSIIITEYFKGNKTETNNEDWVKDKNWGTNLTSDNFVPITLPDGSIAANKLSQEVLDLIGQGFKGNIENHPDSEDLTSTELATAGNTKYKVLKFADRDYTQDAMGYVILRKNKTFAEQVTKSNTTYEIRYNFDLDGKTVNIPDNCVLKFEGGSITNGTIVCNNTEITGNLGGFTSTLLIEGSIKGDTILFDWWKCEKINKDTYDAYINENNSEFGIIPEISNINRTILTNLSRNSYSIKFGIGIYPFDESFEFYISNILKGSGKNNTLLWFPSSDGLVGVSSTNTIVEDLWLESKGACITIKSGTYPHAPIFRDSVFISYTKRCFNQLGNLYGAVFENLAVYSIGNESSAFYGFGSNSNVFRNVVDGHIFFNGKNINKKGYMFSMFYNCSCKEYCDFNVTYSGFKYLFYYNSSTSLSSRIAIFNGTLEMDYDSSNEDKFIRLIHIADESAVWNLNISYYNVYRIGKGKDNIDFYLKNTANTLTFENAQRDITLFINGTLINHSDTIIKAKTKPLDFNNTRIRLVISLPKSTNIQNIYNKNEQNLAIFTEYGFPKEWYKDLEYVPYLAINNSSLYNNIALPPIVTSLNLSIKDIVYRESLGRIEFLDSETNNSKQFLITKNNVITPTTWNDVDSFFPKGDIRYIFQIISDIDLGGITGRVRPSWVFWFNGGSLNNGTLPANNSITYINPKGTVIINGSKDFGSTSNRPILTEINKGFQYYDSTLKKMILWNGTSWVNLDGSALA